MTLQRLFIKKVNEINIYLLSIGEVAKNVQNNLKKDPPLTEHGKMETKLTLKSIKQIKLNFDVIISSPGVGACQTVKMIEHLYGPDVPRALIWDELLPEGDRKILYDKLRTFSIESSVLIIGNKSYLIQLTNEIISNNSRNMKIDVYLKSNIIAKLKIRSLQKFKGGLRWLLSPRILKLLYKSVNNDQIQQNEILIQQRCKR
jgi:phosphohistidine phosphatase SixA